MLKHKVLSSLEKVFWDQEPRSPSLTHATMLRNEVYSLQWAFFTTDQRWTQLHVRVEGPLKEYVSVFSVGNVPVEVPLPIDHDGFVLREQPGLYPDILDPIPPCGWTLLPQQWRSLWISIEGQSSVAQGEQELLLYLETDDGEILAQTSIKMDVLPLDLPQQTLRHTQWFHSDCIAEYYNLEVFSEGYWQRVEQFMRMAVDHGINMILTPVFTPPLDTAVGGERLTVQLVDVRCREAKDEERFEYEFGFDRLRRWVNLARRVGVEYFEFSHLFTQWGAYHAPKIMVMMNGAETPMFGWDTDAASPEYKEFLDQFLPALVGFIHREGLSNVSYFHVSDEPSLHHLDSYAKARELVEAHLEGFPIMDALSNFEFYETGLVPTPIPANNHIEPFLKAGVPGLWTYYCIGQYKKVSQRFVAMPSMRNRVIGLQMYKHDICGFLHWGYNFYNSQYSLQPVNPFRYTDALHWTPAGDAFMVYPGPEGPLASLRLKVFREALQDIRALELLESHIGAEQTKALLEQDLETPLTFSEYPHDAEWLLSVRERVNQALKALSKEKVDGRK